MTTATKGFWLVLLVLVIGAAAVYGWTRLPSPRRWERGYSQIAEGDSEAKVVELLGKPTMIENCDQIRRSRPEMWPKCAEEYRYESFLQEWGYVIGQDGTVLLKWHSVSP